MASLSLPAFIKDGEFDFKLLHAKTKVVTRNLNRVIDVNFYPVPEAEFSNKRHRPIGIGVQGLADTFCILKYAFESQEAMMLNKQIFETIYYGNNILTSARNDLFALFKLTDQDIILSISHFKS